MARELKRMVGVPFDADDFDWSKVPDHLRITFRVVDEQRRKLAEDKDLEALKLRLKPKARKALSQAAAATAERQGGEALERTGLTDWTIGTLPRVFETRRAGPAGQGVPGAGRRRRHRLRTPLRHRGGAGARRCGRARAG